jgi:Leucine-rich repeat (LRR) protein
LSANRIGDSMIQIISKSLESSSSLVNLDVSYNLFTVKGAPVFLKAILNNNTLQRLNIKGNRFTSESLAKIQELKAEKSGMEIID